MKRVELEADQMPGQDSFLDVITNIVGILILLVLVVGLRTSRSVHNGPDPQVAEQARAQDQLRTAYNNAHTTELDVRDLVSRVGNAHGEVSFREGEREWLTTKVVQAEQEIAEWRSKLSTDGQRDFDMRQKLSAAQSQFDDLSRQQIALMSQDEPTEQIECEPTALAKTVTGKELHLLLSEDHVAIVPFDELLDELKKDFDANVWRTRQQDEIVRTIGPINGFRLKYYVVKEDVMRASAAGTYMMGTISRFTDCYFLPVSTPVGEPAAEAMKPNGELFQHLKGLRADGTTVTIWAHPGNYDRLRELKRSIRNVGFQIAVRALPKGTPIGATSDRRKASKSLSE